MEIKDQEFLGVILPDKDNKHQGRYKVYIPVLQPFMKDNEGIWAKNHVTDYRNTPSADGVYGSYFPLHAKTQVIVKFYTEQYTSAYITRITSDHNPESMPFKIIDRDSYYQLIRTPKNNHLIALCEDTATGGAATTANSIHIYYNNKAITLIMDSSGMSINVTAGDINLKGVANTNIQVGQDLNIKVTGVCNIQSDADVHIKAGGDANIEAGGNANVKAGGDANIQSGGSVSIKAGGVCNIDGSMVNLNGGGSSAAKAARSSGAAGTGTPITTTDEFKYYEGKDGTAIITAKG